MKVGGLSVGYYRLPGPVQSALETMLEGLHGQLKRGYRQYVAVRAHHMHWGQEHP